MKLVVRTVDGTEYHVLHYCAACQGTLASTSSACQGTPASASSDIAVHRLLGLRALVVRDDAPCCADHRHADRVVFSAVVASVVTNYSTKSYSRIVKHFFACRFVTQAEFVRHMAYWSEQGAWLANKRAHTLPPPAFTARCVPRVLRVHPLLVPSACRFAYAAR